MHKLLTLLFLVAVLTGCGPAYHYPAGATPYEKWTIDRYYQDRFNAPIKSYTPRKYCNHNYCW